MSMVIPRAIHHTDAATADIASGIATPGTNIVENSIAQGATATIATINVNKLVFTRFPYKEPAVITSIAIKKA
jgi:hypothetical protein